jgi:hypothetical protein
MSEKKTALAEARESLTEYAYLDSFLMKISA